VYYLNTGCFLKKPRRFCITLIINFFAPFPLKLEKRKLDKKPILLERDDILKQELDQDVDSILSAFSSTDRQAILDISTDKEELAKFAKVAVYMNGKYHVEEIMYHMDLRRAQLLAFVDKFRDIIVRHEHEDPALTMYYEPINRG